jgi:hypothetical protein
LALARVLVGLATALTFACILALACVLGAPVVEGVVADAAEGSDAGFGGSLQPVMPARIPVVAAARRVLENFIGSPFHCLGWL